MSMLANNAAATAGQCTERSAAQASAVPAMTGVVDRLSVRGRAAKIHDDGFAGGFMLGLWPG